MNFSHLDFEIVSNFVLRISYLASHGIFTTVEDSLQIRLFMQNKAKFQKVKLNVNKVLTRNYEQMDTWSIGKKQSQTNPNKANFQKAQMFVTTIRTKDYENISNCSLAENKPNTKPNKANSKPIKPNQSQFQTAQLHRRKLLSA